ncbi:MAG: hypothetical protein ACXWYS_04205 [Gaiellaceae bacterium]
MDVAAAPFPDYNVQWSAAATDYRVTIWEQPEMDGVDPELIGWGEMTFDLVGVQDIQEAIEWVEKQLAANQGPYSQSGRPVRDREYVLYVKVPTEEKFVQVAGWNPTVPASSDRFPYRMNLRRVSRPS